MKRKCWSRRDIFTLLKKAVLLSFIAIVIVPFFLILLYRFIPPPVTPLMIKRWLEDGISIDKDWVVLDHISPHLRYSVIAAEDNLFCSHKGFDWKALEAALEDYQNGRKKRGASTISMQTAKNLFLWPERELFRKAIEAYLTVFLELLLDKHRILELYLNIAEWGEGIYGAERAAQYYFDKPASKLTIYEASLMAAVLPNPRGWSPKNPNATVQSRAATYRKRVGQLGNHLRCAD